MWIRNLFDLLNPGRSRTPVGVARRDRVPRRPTPCRPAVEALEDRSVPASLSISDAWVSEGVSGTHNAELAVRLSAPSNKTVRVDYHTTSNFVPWPTATAGSDYEAVSGTLTFAPGETSKLVLVPVFGDRRPEYDEQFDVILQRARGATIAEPWGHVTILDSSPRMSISEFESATETDGFMTFTVSLSAAYDQPLTVNFSTHDGFARPGSADGAYAGQDYVATSGTLTFAPGETTKTITVNILRDTTPEYDEWFYVDLTGPTNAFIYNGYGEGLIYGELGYPPA